MTLACPAAAVAALVDALDDGVGTLASYPDAAPGRWRIEAILPCAPQRVAIETRLALIAAALGIDPPPLTIEPLADVDWLARNRASFPPIAVGPFVVHGEGGSATGRIPIRIDAATAFGTGEHATTRGCLLALAVAVRHRRIARALDVGTGSGVLAIAAARLCRARVLAVDIDPESVMVARRHVRVNGVADLVRVARSDGYRAALVARGAPYDLVLANILARPLAAMALDLARVLARGGVAILSGLLIEQEPWVLWPQRAQGLALARRWRIDGWSTLLLTRRAPNR